ncbi:MAG: tetratricopeptide repeat protein [Myxococcales bacterium]|nr:tetratricopeptide repeat protein [Myxococcales bacterium]
MVDMGGRRQTLLLMLLLMAVWAGDADAEPPPDYFGQGLQHYERGEYEQAIQMFRAGHAAEGHPAYLFNIAQAQRLAGQLEEALASYRAYLAAAPMAENRAEVEQHVAALERQVALAGLLHQAREGQRLLQQGKTEQGLHLLAQAEVRAAQANIDAADRAELSYAYGRALLQAGRTEEAIAVLRRACALSPQDGQMRLDLAVALQRAGDAAAALQTVRQARALALSPQEQHLAAQTAAAARKQMVQDRLTIDASVGLAFDSNVLQGNRETIAGRFTGGTRSGPADSQMRPTLRGVLQDIVTQYRTPVPPRSEPDLPLTLSLDVSGRAVGNRRVSLWAEYHFVQILMTLPRALTESDHDIYNFQEHRAGLRLRSEPLRRLRLAARAQGVANFSGLQRFAPFQGGLLGGLDVMVQETAWLRSRLSLSHEYRASFDRSVWTYVNECGQQMSETDTIFDGHRTTLALSHELRRSWFRGRLGYQFRSDRSGVLEIDLPYRIQNPINPREELVLGCYHYQAPLSYDGHEGHLGAQAELPWQLEASARVLYEYRAFHGEYGALFRPRRDGLPAQTLGYAPRRDHRVSLEVSVARALPVGFSLELTYSLVKNLSSVANGIDNRSYDKHVVALWGAWAF